MGQYSAISHEDNAPVSDTERSDGENGEAQSPPVVSSQGSAARKSKLDCVVTSEADGADTDVGDETVSLEPPGLRKRLGWSGILILIPGSIVILIVMIGLGIFWRQTAFVENAKPSWPWINLYHGNNIPRFITISTAIIRAALTLQASLAMGPLAAIVLETRGTSLLLGPFYSIVRALQVSPISMLWLSYSGPKKSLARSIYAVLVVEVLVIVACQLLSTILLSDLSPARIPQRQKHSSVDVFDRASTVPTIPMLQISSESQWSFAEAMGPRPAQSNDSDSTEVAYRAFLPFYDEESRTKLRFFRGPATVIDAHVSCVRPEMTNVTSYPGTLSGSVSVKRSALQGGSASRNPVNVTFECSPPLFNSSYANGTSLCYVYNGFQHVTTKLLSNFPQPDSDPRDEPIVLLIDVISDVELTRAELNLTRISNGTRWPDQDWNYRGPWAIASGGAHNTDLMRITACSASFRQKTQNITMTRTRIPLAVEEPHMYWNQTTNMYLTDHSRNQLRATSDLDILDPERYGVMLADLSSGPQLGDDATMGEASEGSDSTYFWDLLLTSIYRVKSLLRRRSLPSSFTTRIGWGEGSIQAHPMHADLFQDILSDTNRPALALQALLTRLCQIAFYDRIKVMHSMSEATIANAESVRTPNKWTGFMVATALIGTHWILIFTATMLFLRRTKTSLIGNVWQAVAQAISEETRPILENAHAKTDGEVEAWGKREKLNLSRPVVLRPGSEGRMTLHAYEKKRN